MSEDRIITKIVQQKKDETKFNIYIDGEYAFALPLSDVAFFKMKEGGILEEEKYDYIINETVYIKAQEKALDYIGYKMRTEKEVRDKLKTLEYNEIVTERVIEFLLKYKYVDDFKYAESYIRQTLRLKPMGKYGIKMKLRQYGVKDRIIDNALLESDIDEAEDAYNLLIKKTGGETGFDQKEKKKLQDFLLRRGYSYDIIKEVFKKAEI